MANDKDSDNEIFVLVVLVALAAIIYLIATNFFLVAAVWKWIRLVELAPFYWAPDWMPVYGKLDVAEAVRFLWNTDADLIAPETVQEFDRVYPRWFAWVPGMLLVYLGWRKQSRATRINERFDEETLLKRIAPQYEYLLPYVRVNPNNKPTVFKRGSADAYKYAGPISEALFATLSPPRLLEEDAKKDSSINAPIWDGDIGFDLNLAERAFEAQLAREGGGPWCGVEHLPELDRKVFDRLERCMPLSEDEDLSLLSHYLSTALRDPDLDPASLPYGDQHVFRVCRAYVDHHCRKSRPLARALQAGDWATVRAALGSQIEEYDFLINFYQVKAAKNALRRRRARAVMDRHAFVYTGFISLLTEARRTGIIAVSEYLHFVKGKNRTLLYTLQSAGKRVAFVEAAGVVAHWRVECEVGRPVKTPAVQEAVKGLHIALRLDDKTTIKRNAPAPDQPGQEGQRRRTMERLGPGRRRG